MVAPIRLKTRTEIQAMRRGGQIAADILHRLTPNIAPGVTTRELDDLARYLLDQSGARSSYEHHANGFPGVCCISVNETLLHGAPDDRRLSEGDIVKLDVGVFYEGLHVSRAISVPVGTVSPDAERLLAVGKSLLTAAIAHCGPGQKWSTVAQLMTRTATDNGFHILREYASKGIGREMIEPPTLPNVFSSDVVRNDVRLKPGMTLCIDPVVLGGSRSVHMSENGYTPVADDGQPAVHFRDTIAINADGVEVLTLN